MNHLMNQHLVMHLIGIIYQIVNKNEWIKNIFFCYVLFMRSIKISSVECLHLVIAGLLIACYSMTMSLQKSLAIFGLWSLVRSKYYAIFQSGFCNHCKMLSYLVDFWSSFLPSTNASSDREKKRHLYKTTTIIKFSDDSFFHFVTNLTHIEWTVHYFYTVSVSEEFNCEQNRHNQLVARQEKYKIY